jgi:predicted ester cyclase
LEVPFGSNGYLYGSLPDRTNRILSIIAKGDRVWVIWLFTGHQTGKMFGAPPSGKELNVREMAMVRYKNDKLIEADYWGDDFALYSQLGGKVEFPGH